MNTTHRHRRLAAPGLVALALCVAAAQACAGQNATQAGQKPEDRAGFKEFTDRVQAYVVLQKAVVKTLPPLKSTDVPEMISAYQQALARKIREARPAAKPGDIFTDAAREAFRRVSQTVLEGPRTTNSRGYANPDGPNLDMALEVNGIYPDTESITAPSPELLAAFPPLPAELAYRFVGPTLILIDVNSRLIVDVAHLIRPLSP